MKRLFKLLFLFVSFLFLEIVFKIAVFKSVFSLSLINIVLFTLFLSLLCFLISSIFGKKLNAFLYRFILLFAGLFYALQECVFNLFGIFFSFSLFGAAGQTLEFGSDIINVIIKNIIWIILFLLPFILSFVFGKSINQERMKGKKILLVLLTTLISFGLFFGSLFINKNAEYSPYKLYFNYHDITLSVEKLGVLDTLNLDIVKTVTHFEENIEIINYSSGQELPPESTKYAFNNLDINFEELQNKGNATQKNMAQYFAAEPGTLQNEYTGYFKDKNLILFMAESFNEITVSEELTPTLYKLTHSGFVFNNFYTPTISSTIGGEFQELTGLYAASGFVTPWKNGNNAFPMGIARLFKEAGYSTFAYHNHSYTFQNRNKYLKALGFDNFKGCFNGLEKNMNCRQWPESDIEMIDVTFDDYADSEKPFMVFYATVSGHGDYSFGGHAIASKNKEYVKDLPYSEKVKVYLAANIELDRALKDLIDKLEEIDKLDDTVIALVGDHYPYFLNVDEVNEVSTYKKDSVVEINHSNFIFWNSQMDTIEISKVGSQIDVLPTIYNAFGLPYDSRLIIGKDILSTEPGLAMFGNRSWVSDYGTYFASTGNFVPKEGVEVDEDYVKKTNYKVSNRINMSKLILTEDYYRKALGD